MKTQKKTVPLKMSDYYRNHKITSENTLTSLIQKTIKTEWDKIKTEKENIKK